jgi:predicted secreted hydrolase
MNRFYSSHRTDLLTLILIFLIMSAAISGSFGQGSNFRKIKFPKTEHGSVNKEWSVHKNAVGWWYITGTFTDENDKLYSYQFTVIRSKAFILRPVALHLALTDFDNQKHYFKQEVKPGKNGVIINDTVVQFSNEVTLTKDIAGMHLACNTTEFSLRLDLGYGKEPVWQCNNGYLKMGSEKAKGTTLYYSYTNMPTTGKLSSNGKTVSVKGKSWFDRQSGPFNILDRKTNWEWFSMRFDDNEEVMLFTFPQNDYQDGTFVQGNGICHRLVNYSVIPLDYITTEGLKFSSGWEIHMPGIKDGLYKILPLMKSQTNVFYIEQLCNIVDNQGRKTGMCFVELLPGVYNKGFTHQMKKNIVRY